MPAALEVVAERAGRSTKERENAAQTGVNGQWQRLEAASLSTNNHAQMIKPPQRPHIADVPPRMHTGPRPCDLQRLHKAFSPPRQHEIALRCDKTQTVH